MFSLGYVSILILSSLAVFLPLAFGATQPWAIFVFEAAVVTAFLAWLFAGISERYIDIKKTWLYLPVIVMLSAIIMQIVPLPAVLVRALSPGLYEFRSFAAEFCGKGIPHYMSLSMNADATLNELVKLSCTLLVFFLATHSIKSLRQAENILALIFILGFFIAVFAIIQKFSWNGNIYWCVEVPGNSGPFGPFVNYDHYGGYMNLLIMTGFGFILSGIHWEKKVLAGFMASVMGASLFLSNSRGAVFSFIGGVFVLALMLFIGRRNYKKKALWLLLVAAIFIVLATVTFIYWIDWAQFTGRLRSVLYLEDNFFNPRLDIWKDSFRMVKDFAVAGTGFGTYGMVFPAYQASHLNLFWRYTHCDYLQLLIETGPLPVLCVLVFIALIFTSAVRKISTSRNHHLSGLLAGCSAALATMVLHSIVDFNMHITSNAYLAALIGGIVFAFTRISRERESDLFELSFSRWSSITASLVGVAIALSLLVPSVRSYAAYRVYSQSLKDTDQYIKLMKKSTQYAPGNAFYHYELGLLYQEESSGAAASERDRLLHAARNEFCTAVYLSPSEANYWASIAWNLANLNEKDKSREAMSHALRVAPSRTEIKKFRDNYEKTFGSF